MKPHRQDMMQGNGSYKVFKDPTGVEVDGDIWGAGEPNNDGRTFDYFNGSDETVSSYAGGKLYDIWETCISPNGANYFCDAVCQYSAPTGNWAESRVILSVLYKVPSCHFSDCLPPPLRPNDNASNITVIADPPGLEKYPFGTNVMYRCPLGKVFSGTISGSLVATCYGAYGWRRPFRLICAGNSAVQLSEVHSKCN